MPTSFGLEGRALRVVAEALAVIGLRLGPAEQGEGVAELRAVLVDESLARDELVRVRRVGVAARDESGSEQPRAGESDRALGGSAVDEQTRRTGT